MPKNNIHSVAELQEAQGRLGEESIVAAKLLHIHEFCLTRPGGIFLELGTDRGQATNAILEACDEGGGNLVSVDIRDCRSAASSPHWTFIQCSSVDVDTILKNAPDLKNGIDMVYVDSLHTAEHVRQEINAWMPFLKVGGRMYFDDVDSGPYLQGSRKDSVTSEISNRAILNVIQSYFRKNIQFLNLSVMYGSSGLAWIDKRAALSENHKLGSAEIMRERRYALPYRIMKRLGLYRPYQNMGDGADFILK